ncbi:Hypothetical predicted protein [Mytilus galloprovincialis]|uniref:Mutator-like transposase domain-containing protein n=1 Tax=Mytilus galloprovincialis TaxID=29158 RepID=A0A8B6FQ63_MYTGA|nr:Hypothetical predicted protein [Mytilus galloprovincialis]
MDSPTMAQNTFSVIEKEINQWWKVMVEEEMASAIDLEKKIAIEKNRYHEDIPSITVICDGGWSKRSHKHSYNALGGVAVVIGAETKKILHIGIRNKYCYICNRCNSLGITPKDHECFKNWTESSQSMESDIIVEGFLKANDFGVRYMHFIADGDSSIHAQIMERVPVWGKFVQKMECANHITKCLRGNLENLVNENPSYKGKGKLCKRTRIRIVSAVRCSIRRRSSEKNKTLAIKNLEHDIRNTTSHIYGDHTRCNEDFCKVKQTLDKNHSNGAQTDAVDDNDDDNGDDDIFLQQSEMWTQGTSLQAQEQSRGSYMLSNSDLQSGMRQDLALLLNNVARKARSLLGNFTTNLAECWMHMRTKFDGGKILNHCNRGSWHTRCYATALRFNKGPTWSPNVWEQATESTPGAYFEKLYEQRKQCINNNNTTKDKCTIKTKPMEKKDVINKRIKYQESKTTLWKRIFAGRNRYCV